jgi:hypothetical protein
VNQEPIRSPQAEIRRKPLAFLPAGLASQLHGPVDVKESTGNTPFAYHHSCDPVIAV